MRVRGLIRASVSLFALALSTACAREDQCATLHEQIEIVRTGAETLRTSDRWDFNERGGRFSIRRLELELRGDFRLALEPNEVAVCLGEWTQRRADELVEGWAAPATIFERADWPSVMAFSDEDQLQVVVYK